MPTGIIAETERRMKAALADLQTSFGTLRTGRASPALLDKIVIEAYGSFVPLNQLATVSAPEPRQLLVKPFDKSMAGQIANVISKSDLGVQATKDGDAVRVSIPALNEERRKEMVKLAGKEAEKHKVSIRNIRREANDGFKKMEKDGAITKDEVTRYEGDVQKLTDRMIADVDKMRAAKEVEILEV